MKLTYGITLEDFKTLFPPAAKVRKPKPGLYFAMVMGALVALVGILITLKALDVISTFSVPEGTVPQGAGTVVFGLGVIAFCLWRERHADLKIRERYESDVAARFKSLHCNNNRTIECSPDGIETSCACGSSKRPWGELRAFTEGPLFFLINTRQEAHLIPKRAFASASEQTQFRALFGEHVQVAPVLSGTRIQFVRTRSDARSARMLHLLKGLTFQQKFNLVVTPPLLIVAVVIAVRFLSSNPNYPIGLGVGILLLSSRFLPWIKRKRNHYFGTITASFSPDGIEIQDSASTATYRWSDFRGYVKNSSYWLLYHKDRSYRAFPRRAFQLNQASDFNRLVEQNLRPITSPAL